jgi:hypothetical protein
MNEFDIELEYEYRWETGRRPGDWSCAVFLQVPPLRHFIIGIQVFGHTFAWGRMLKIPTTKMRTGP